MPPDRTSAEFGSRLRAARERRGMSLREIAAATKISIGVLEALERNDVSRLPGGIFSRAFVRSYAVQVGLDPEQTVRDFVAQWPEDPHPPLHASTIEDGTAFESERRMASTFLGLLAISIPLAGVVLYFATSGRPKPAQPPVAPAEASPALQSSQPALPTQSAPAVATPTEQAPAAAPAGVPPPAPLAVTAADTLTVVITVTRPCWVAATADGQRIVEGLLQAGEQRTINVKQQLVLTAGDAGAVEMTLNGAAARPLGKAGEVVTTRLNLSNFRGFLASR